MAGERSDKSAGRYIKKMAGSYGVPGKNAASVGRKGAGGELGGAGAACAWRPRIRPFGGVHGEQLHALPLLHEQEAVVGEKLRPYKSPGVFGSVTSLSTSRPSTCHTSTELLSAVTRRVPSGRRPR